MKDFKKKAWKLLTLFVLAWLMTGCSAADRQEEAGYKLFCVNQQETALREVPYEPKAEGGEELVKELLNAMAGEITSSDCKSVFAEGLSVKVSTLKDGRLTIDFNVAYRMMSSVQEVLFRAAVVQTMTQITDVQEVVFTIEGEALLNSAREAVGPMKASSFINSEGESIHAYQYEALSIYFASLNGKTLVKQMRNVHYAPDASLVQLVVEQLIAGPSGSKLLGVIPEGTAILDVQVEKKVCTVNFSKELNQAVADSATTPEATVYAIVNSICDNCENIEQVRLQIEGNSDVRLRDTVDLSKPFKTNRSMIREKDGGSAKESEANVPSVGVDPNLAPEETEGSTKAETQTQEESSKKND